MRDHVVEALRALLPQLARPSIAARVEVTPTRDPAHGDMATNAAMVAAKPAGQNPRALAQSSPRGWPRMPLLDSAEPAGPGFVNLRLSPRRCSTRSRSSCGAARPMATGQSARAWR